MRGRPPFPGFEAAFGIAWHSKPLAEITFEEQMNALDRHAQGDWGNLDREDWAENELALREGFRLFSVYLSRNDVKFWIITEADRSITTILLPEEY